MGVNKVVYGNRTLIDLTGDTVTPETLCKGYTALNAAGDLITGTLEATPAVSSPTSGPNKVNLIRYGSRVLMDLSQTTVYPGAIVEGVIAHDKTGKSILGTLIPLIPFQFPFSNESLTENRLMFIKE